ncbi:MAG: chromate efflux transporter [Hyphomonadaceae bacterium]|nr:chromate efflux transporter [Hyphomonadaceae bacterium]
MTPLAEIFFVFLRLGLTSFGGPVAHLGYFREAFVVRRKWIDEAAYADLVALCQFLPGPASSQVGFALGLKRGGTLGGLAAWLGFTAPSAMLMLAVAGGLAWFVTPAGQAVAHGLKLVALVIVAHAVLGMARSLVRDVATGVIAIFACAALMLFPVVWMQPLVIVLGGLICVLRRPPSPAAPVLPPQAGEENARSETAGAYGRAFLFVFVALLLALPFLANLGGPFAIADAFYRAGAFVFGGGHVVLPLLEAETVGRGWLGQDAFLAGYGAAQALPGPLFAFAAFLGASGGPMPGVTGGLVALAFLFLPGLLLVAALLPHWEALKVRPGAVHFVAGAGAAVVGVLAAALYNPVFTSAVRGWPDIAIAAAGFALLQWMKTPAWLVVLIVTVAGAGSVLAASGAPVH